MFDFDLLYQVKKSPHIFDIMKASNDSFISLHIQPKRTFIIQLYFPAQTPNPKVAPSEMRRQLIFRNAIYFSVV